MSIDLTKFRLSMENVTIKRYEGEYVDGVFNRTQIDEFTTRASVQPYSTIEQDQIFEPDSGERFEDIRLMYTKEKIYINDNSNTENQVTDIIEVLGVEYRPVKVEYWQHLGLQHYKSVLRLFDGD